MIKRGHPALSIGAQCPLLSISDSSFYNRTADLSPTDERGMAYSYAYVGIRRLGAGQFYLISTADKDRAAMGGAATYRLTVPPEVPIEQYWSATAYDRVTHALIRHMDRASRSSQIPDLAKNPDGSVDIWFGPEAPARHEANWIPTDPLRNFEVMSGFTRPPRRCSTRAGPCPTSRK